MPLRKFHYRPERRADAAPAPRLAADQDAFVPSPVHRMQQNLWSIVDDAPEPPADLYPGWVRVTLPLVASGAMWWGIAWALGYVR